MDRINSCYACTMIAAGVKFRKAPTHTCNKFKPKTFKLPKLDPEELFLIKIQRGQIVETKGAMRVRCCKQELEGVIIPNGFEIWIPGGTTSSIKKSFSSSPEVLIPGWKLNGILKLIVMEGLRNG